MLLDHLSKWVRTTRQNSGAKGHASSRRVRVDEVIEHITRVDSVVLNINRDLMARAALQCKAYALALMNFEQQVIAMRKRSPLPVADIQESYERLHEIYASLDEPDGMEGVSVLVVAPSLEHQIRQHESTGRWTSAQSCWEVRLQQSPDMLEYHIGLLRCLRNLGHYGKFFLSRAGYRPDFPCRHIENTRQRCFDSQPPMGGHTGWVSCRELVDGR
jgi:serine/threonine-protein kinase ATR